MHVEWKFSMSNFHTQFLWRHNGVYQVITIIFEWGISMRNEYQARMRINREASHSVGCPLAQWSSEQIKCYTRLQPRCCVLLHQQSTIGPMKIIQCAVARVVTSHLSFGSSRVESVESCTNFNGNESQNTDRVTGNVLVCDSSLTRLQHWRWP